MADAESKTPVTDAKWLFQGGIFVLLLLAFLRYASEIIIPVVFACILKLVFQPLLRVLDRWRIPRILSSLCIVIMFIGLLTLLGAGLSGPAAYWLDKLPQTMPKIQHELGFISDSLEGAHKVLEQAEDLTQTGTQKVMPVAVQGSRLSDRIFMGTQALVSGMFTTFIVLFFLLVKGDTFLRKLVEVLSRFSDKRQAVHISQQIEQDLSHYLFTITVMNACVGIASSMIMLACGVHNPFLWGALAFILNYIPLLGPLCVVGLFLFAGLISLPAHVQALLPALLYLLLHILEGSFITPILLASRFTLNPVLVVLSLIFWYWMWGFAGAILAVPMLAIMRIICDHIERLKAVGHFLSD